MNETPDGPSSTRTTRPAMPGANEELPLDPAEMLALARSQQDAVSRRLARQIPWILVAWGVAWTVGFGLLWLIDGARPAFSVPLPVAAGAFAALMVAAIVVSAVVGTLSGRGIRSTPAAAFTGIVYGVTGSVAFVAMYVFAAGLVHNGMPPELQSIYFPVASSLIVGIMYLIAAAIWHQVPMIYLGGWIILVALVCPFFGYPHHYLVLATAGGGAFFVSALLLAIYTRTGRLRVGG